MTPESSTPREPLEQAWTAYLERAQGIFSIGRVLAESSEAEVFLRTKLQENVTYALVLLGLMNIDYTRAVLDAVVGFGLSQKHIVRVRELLARLPHAELESTVAPLLLEQLVEGDDDSYRRVAEILYHLGLADALAALAARALASDDRDVREVGEDFAA